MTIRTISWFSRRRFNRCYTILAVIAWLGISKLLMWEPMQTKQNFLSSPFRRERKRALKGDVVSRYFFWRWTYVRILLHVEPPWYSIVMCQLRKEVGLCNYILVCFLSFTFILWWMRLFMFCMSNHRSV